MICSTDTSELVMPIHLLTTQSLQTQCQAVKKAESTTPHLFSSNQDIVAWFQEAKCGLKYEIFSFALSDFLLFKPRLA
jgi:hypothetical protein